MFNVSEKLRAEGEREALIKAIPNLMESLKFTAEEAMNALKISPEKQKELAPLIEKNWR